MLKADGFNDAIIGVDNNMRVVYDIRKMVNVLVNRDGMSEEEAQEFLDYNTLNCYVGPNTPIYVNVTTDRPLGCK